MCIDWKVRFEVYLFVIHWFGFICLRLMGFGFISLGFMGLRFRCLRSRGLNFMILGFMGLELIAFEFMSSRIMCVRSSGLGFIGLGFKVLGLMSLRFLQLTEKFDGVRKFCGQIRDQWLQKHTGYRDYYESIVPLLYTKSLELYGNISFPSLFLTLISVSSRGILFYKFTTSKLTISNLL